MQYVSSGRIVFQTIEEEQELKIGSLSAAADAVEAEFVSTLQTLRVDEPVIHQALEFAKGLKFDKSPLRGSYMTHPIRVAWSLVRIEPTVGCTNIVTALLHNVPEVSSITIEELKEHFGAQVSDGINLLVVDRSVPFAEIDDKYYKNIFAFGKELTLIKLLDKIDNLFVLSSNPDGQVRERYLTEIRKWLIPFAKDWDPQLGQYVEELVSKCASSGFQPSIKSRIDEALR